jgi:hypothetical protein
LPTFSASLKLATPAIVPAYPGAKRHTPPNAP